MYGTDYMNAKKVLTAKLSKSEPNPENLSLAERILLNRQRGKVSHRQVVGVALAERGIVLVRDLPRILQNYRNVPAK